MRAQTPFVALALSAAGVLFGTGTAAAQNAVHEHIRHAAVAFIDTPAGMGLLPVALAEAQTAALHAGLGAEDPMNLDGMRRHAGHVLNALDPSVMLVGPALGYGVKQGTIGALEHVELAGAAEGASENVTTHVVHITTALANVVLRVDEAIALAQRVQGSGSATDAARWAAQLSSLCDELVYGVDGNRDGRVGWHEGEGGLNQATQHMNLMQRGEGLSP